MTLLRTLLIALAALHLFPVRRHLPLMLHSFSASESWKALGAIAAVIVLCLPIALLARSVTRMSRRAPLALGALAWILVAAHLVPALDHVPAFAAHPNFADGWRALGSMIGVAWFSLPFASQVALIGRFSSIERRWAATSRAAVRA